MSATTRTRFVAVTVVLLLLTGCRSESDAPPPSTPVLGAKIYAFEGDPTALFRQWKALGLNTAFVGKELFSDEAFREAARQQGIDTYVVLPTFYDPEALDADPSLAAITKDGAPAVDDWVRFVCPSHAGFRRNKVEEIRRVVREWDPDGISIDFIRHFVFWESVFPDTPVEFLPNSCFDDRCMMRFEQETQITVPDSVRTPQLFAAWTNEFHLERWIQWKCELITEMVQEIVMTAKAEKPTLKINLHIVPWRSTDYHGARKLVAGQDLQTLSPLSDFISPMTYHHMVKRPPFWVHDVVADMQKESQAPVLPSIQVGKAYLEEGLSTEAFGDALVSALRPPSAGVVFWSWERLAESPEKQALVKEVLVGSAD